MMARRARVLILWVGCIALAAFVVARAHYITDLSAFLPANPTPVQQLARSISCAMGPPPA